MAGAAFNRGGSCQTYQTDPEFIAAVIKRFGVLNWDLAAEAGNAQAPKFITPEQDSFQVDWDKLGEEDLPGNLWLNPPFSNIRPWAQKCANYRGSGRVLFLVPASVGSNWFADLIVPNAHTLLLNGRLTFVGQKDPYPKDCMLCVFDPSSYLRGLIDVWKWK